MKFTLLMVFIVFGSNIAAIPTEEIQEYHASVDALFANFTGLEHIRNPTFRELIKEGIECLDDLESSEFLPTFIKEYISDIFDVNSTIQKRQKICRDHHDTFLDVNYCLSALNPSHVSTVRAAAQAVHEIYYEFCTQEDGYSVFKQGISDDQLHKLYKDEFALVKSAMRIEPSKRTKAQSCAGLRFGEANAARALKSRKFDLNQVAAIGNMQHLLVSAAYNFDFKTPLECVNV